MPFLVESPTATGFECGFGEAADWNCVLSNNNNNDNNDTTTTNTTINNNNNDNKRSS